MKRGILEKQWKEDQRWRGVVRPYKAEEVLKLQGSLKIEHTLSFIGATKLWSLLEEKTPLRALGAVTGHQAVQQVAAGLKSIYVSGWQVAADHNEADETYPDLSLYPVNSMPQMVRRIQKALIRADQIQKLQGDGDKDWFMPLVVDAEAGFGGALNTFELIKHLIEAGAAGIHLEDQLSSLKKCGHMGGKVLVPCTEFIEKLITARLAADVLEVPVVLIGRTDAEAATWIRLDNDPVDQAFILNERSHEGFFKVQGGIDYAIARAVAFAPYVDVVWCETQTPDIKMAEKFAQGVHSKYPGKKLAYNCSPSFNWTKIASKEDRRTFQKKLGEMGYKYQFVTLAGFHTLNASMFDLASNYLTEGMEAYAAFQEKEFELEKKGYHALKHQTFVGAGYFDEVMMTLSGGKTSSQALKGSTEGQFEHH